MDFLKGRKGRKKDKEPDSSLDSLGSPPSESSSVVPPRARSRRLSGWTDDKTKTSTNIIEQERFTANKESPINEDEIPTIPDLDEFQEDNIIEMAPSQSVSMRLAAYNDLCQDGAKIESYSALDDLDLSLLEKCLEPGDLQEPDEEWAWDSLFAQIFTEIMPRKDSASREPENGTTKPAYVH